MGKKKSKEYQKLWDTFQSELNDNELRGNYESYHNKLEELHPEYKSMFIHNQKMENEMAEIKDAILLSALNGISTEALSQKFRTLDSAADELQDKMNIIASEINYNESQIKKYDDFSERKLFHWWCIFNTIDDDFEPWLFWKETFDKTIF